jgi:putative FmdB family regulatory protein
MPIYSYICAQCGAEFDKLVLSASRLKDVVCPVCGSREVERRPAVFGVGGSRDDSGARASSSCAPTGG